MECNHYASHAYQSQSLHDLLLCTLKQLIQTTFSLLVGNHLMPMSMASHLQHNAALKAFDLRNCKPADCSFRFRSETCLFFLRMTRGFSCRRSIKVPFGHMTSSSRQLFRSCCRITVTLTMASRYCWLSPSCAQELHSVAVLLGRLKS